MQVFLSWSGSRSHALAAALNDYLPVVIQSVTPWFSPDDIDKGSRWLADLTDQLQKQSVAIVCITPESVNSPWLLFEAGALSKALEAAWVCPVLLDIEPSDIKGPLAQFQATRLTKEDVRKLLGTLNRRLEVQLGDAQIDKIHDVLWVEFEKKIKAIQKPKVEAATVSRSQLDLLSEVLERVRGIERKITETVQPPDLNPRSYTVYSKSRNRPASNNTEFDFDFTREELDNLSEYQNSTVRAAMLEHQLAGLIDHNSKERLQLRELLAIEQAKLARLRMMNEQNPTKSMIEAKNK